MGRSLCRWDEVRMDGTKFVWMGRSSYRRDEVRMDRLQILRGVVIFKFRDRKSRSELLLFCAFSDSFGLTYVFEAGPYKLLRVGWAGAVWEGGTFWKYG